MQLMNSSALRLLFILKELASISLNDYNQMFPKRFHQDQLSYNWARWKPSGASRKMTVLRPHRRYPVQ